MSCMSSQKALDADPRLRPGQRPPGTGVRPAPEGQVLLGVGPVHPELVRVLEPAGIASGRAVEHHDRRAGGDVDSAHRRPGAGQPEVALDRALVAQALLDEVRDAAAVLAEATLDVGVVPDRLQRGAEQPDRRLLAGREHVGRHPDHVDHLGHRPVGEGGRGQAGQHVLTGLAPALFHVLGQALVEELEGRVAHGARAGAAQTFFPVVATALELLAEPFVVLFGNAQEIGDDVEREGSGEIADELALAPLHELVDLTVGVAPHEVFVLAQPLRRDQPHQEPAVRLVLRAGPWW